MMKSLMIAMAALLATPAMAGVAPDDSLDVAAPDTVVRIYRPDRDPRPIYQLYALARPYKDKIVVRWANTHYMPWRVNNTFGYCITRLEQDGDTMRTDTLYHRLTALTLRQMMARYTAADSLAGVAAQLMWGRGAEDINASRGMGGIMDAYDEQQSRFADAMILAEFRADLAEAMALRIEDRNVKPGCTYEYRIYPLAPDSVVRTRPTTVRVLNTPYTPAPYVPMMADSLLAQGHVLDLYWDKSDEYSAYDVERRREGDDTWHRMNANPFITMSVEGERQLSQNIFTDRDIEIGTYYYRVRGIDAFAERGPWSPEYRVDVKDMEPPQAPFLKFFELHRNDDNTDIRADIHWTKDSLEEDMAGYNIYYYHPTRGKHWIKLNDTLLAATDSMFTADVSGFASGSIIVAAVDTAGNQGASMPVPIEIADLVPPSAPTGLHNLVLPDGRVILTWTPNPEPDVAGYQVFIANDPTHPLQPVGPMVTDTAYVDTLAIVGVNQRYVYYALAAYDFAGNTSEVSPLMRVQRISYTQPESCVPDTLWQNDSTLFIDWRCFSAETTKEYRLYRRLEGNPTWSLVQVIPAEDAPHNIVHTWDSPLYNYTKRYFYALETVNAIGMTGGLEHEVSFWHKGPMTVDVPITLTYEITKLGRLILRWEATGDVPLNHLYMVQVMRQGRDHYADLRTLDGRIQELTLSELEEGEQAKYRVYMRWRDGRTSTPSNEIDVTLKRPRDDDEEEQQ